MLPSDQARAQRTKANQARLAQKEKISAQQRQRRAAKKNPPTPSTHIAPVSLDTVESARSRKTPRNQLEESEDCDDDEYTESCLHPDDPTNFLKLCKALQILISRTVTDEHISRADALLRDYCKELITVRIDCFISF